MIDLAEQLEPLAVAPSPAGADGLGDLRHRADRRRRHKRIAVVGLSVLLVVALVAGVAVARSTSPPRPPVTAGPLPPVPSVGAAALARGHWGTIPAAPIRGRLGAAWVWTGHEVIVWGGISTDTGRRYTNDGAAYDPSTRRWRPVPAAPLSPRSAVSAVWTGTEMVVWGGVTGSVVNKTRPAGDGAAYDPETNRWRRLAPSPLSPRLDARLVWTGRQVLVTGGQTTAPTSRSGHDASGMWIEEIAGPSSPQSAGYDPATDTWSRLPDLPVPAHHRLDSLTAVWAGGQLLEWWEWAHTITTKHANGTQDVTIGAGVDLYTYDPGANAWRLDELPTDGSAPYGVQGAFADGAAVVLPAASAAGAAYEKGPLQNQLHSWTYDTVTRRYTSIPLGRTDGAHASTAWTGDALVSLNPGTEVTGGAAGLLAGDGEAWDPATNRWTDLPRVAPPLSLSVQFQPVWTGHQLIDFGGGPSSQPLFVLGGVALTPG